MQQGFVHRDVKLSNFVLGLAGSDAAAKAFIIDFGLARRVVHARTGEHVAERPDAEFRGTSMYVRVEQQRWMDRLYEKKDAWMKKKRKKIPVDG